MSETTRTTLCIVQHIALHPLGLFVTCYDHLGYALAIDYLERSIGEVHKDDAHLATIIGVDGSG